MINTKKIFIADDDIFTSAIFKQHLHNLGYDDVTCFSDGTSCLNELTEKPGIVLLDHQMDDLNGFEVLKKSNDLILIFTWSWYLDKKI
ncbi:MAG: response regulator [Saprospiraceae bacterium]|nr:response regulator [Saprospiraceae bacterium]